jgi:hypothetical protein
MWLRCSLYFEIGLLKKLLIVKHGGHVDQLSRKFPVMDRFRIMALEKIFLNSAPKFSALTPEQKSALLKTLQEKCWIVARGALKRGRLITAFNYWMKFLQY